MRENGKANESMKYVLLLLPVLVGCTPRYELNQHIEYLEQTVVIQNQEINRLHQQLMEKQSGFFSFCQ